ncbi:hypothetical protein NL676_008288 [Syzygium grande]|nr:hypothetical protein NL676_008288 [Syzygium grande]
MISVLRRISASASTSPFLKLMNNSLPPPPSRRLVALAQQLRLYKPPPDFEDAEEQRIEETAGKVVSQVGFPESATPNGPRPGKVHTQKSRGDDGELRVILTKRSFGLSTHSGEVSLPGGKAEEGDKDDGDTATREAKEEIGLDPSLVNVVTVLEPFLSKHLLRVMPVIGILTDKKSFKPIPNPAEVEAVFDAPLEMFIKDENRSDEEREWLGNKYIIHFFDYEAGNKKYLIWGLTAGILIRAASVVYQRPPALWSRIQSLEFLECEDVDQFFATKKINFKERRAPCMISIRQYLGVDSLTSLRSGEIISCLSTISVLLELSRTFFVQIRSSAVFTP